MNVPLLAEAFFEGQGALPPTLDGTDYESRACSKPLCSLHVTKINFLPWKGSLSLGFFMAWIWVGFGGGWALVWPIVMEIDCMLFFLLLM